MDTYMKADIFFFISTVSTVIISLGLAVLLYYLIKAGRNLLALTEKFKEGIDGSEEFLLDLRDRLEENVIFRFLFPPTRRKRRKVEKVQKKEDVK